MRFACVLTFALLTASGAQAHDARPLFVSLIEQTQGVYRAAVRLPPSLTSNNAPQVIWPSECERLEPDNAGIQRRDPGEIHHVGCPNGLAGLSIRIEYPVFNPSLSTLLRLQSASGMTITAVLPPDEAQWLVPEEPTLASVASDYAVLGFAHIWEGPDHLLFVAGLMLLAMRPRRIFWAVTGFTAAHSITLSAAALNFVRVPIAPTEAMIALSILFLAAEIARQEPESFSRRFPITLSFGFGLLHGFGFASALGEIGLPGSELVAGLLFFNIGVELGQLAFIAVAAAVYAAWRLARSSVTALARFERRLPLAGAYILGIPAAFWFIERAALALQG